jgi:hypothetical protein
LVVQLDSIENTIDNVTRRIRFLDEWMVIVGNEICSAFGATLLGAGKYRLFLVRERFDTAREAHNIGAEVWVVLAAGRGVVSGARTRWKRRRGSCSN